MMAPLKKWKISNRSGSFKRRKRAGMILVVTLAIIVLVTIAVLAFFSHALLNRQVESSRTNRAKAGLLAYTGQDYVTGLFLGEIAANSVPSATNGVTLYFPKSSTNSMAMRMVGPNVSTSDTNFFNLIRQSAPAADANASTHSTAEAARNGRLITTDRWNAPRLLPGQGFSQTNQLPCWIYVTRSGGITNTPSNDVIGRFAYNVYDLGGLLDVSAAGYPSVSTNISSLKGTAAGADLMQLPGLTQSAVDSLLAFRNPGAVSDASTYAEAVTAFEGDGFLSASATNSRTGRVFTNNAFLNRQDLLRYARTQNTALTNALPYLTQFSRSLNAPSWTPPSTPANSNPRIPDVRVSTGGSVTHYDDNGKTSAYSVKAGEPFVQRRFSLAKLAWLTPEGPSALLPSTHAQYNAGGTPAAIQACFGLKWDDSNPIPLERWNYVGPSGKTIQSEIKALDKIAAETSPREPNFFELLKSGILTGSLGGTALGKTSADGKLQKMTMLGADALLVDANKDLHILKIGANIIDCADSDNFPTRLAMAFGPETLECAGVENLPYFYSVDTANLREVEVIPGDSTAVPPVPTKYKVKSCHFVWVPELFCPHTRDTINPPPPGPSSITIGMEGNFDNVAIASGGGLSNKFPGGAPTTTDFSLLTIDVSSSTWDNFRAAPGPIRDAKSTMRLELLTPGATTTDKDLVAFHIYSYPVNFARVNTVDDTGGYPTTVPFTMTSGDARAVVTLHDVFVTLSFKTPNNQTKVYATTGGYRELPSTGINGLYKEDSFSDNVLTHSGPLKSPATIDKINSPAIILPDARSSRFGPMFLRYQRSAGEAPGFTSIPDKSMPFPYFFWPLVPFSNLSPNLRDFPGNLPQLPGFQDPDTILRSPDAGIGFTGNGKTPTQANPYGSLTDMTRRPVILQRPFQNVAELGYVFRDVPWQTLNFYNSQSADSALLDLFSVMDEAPVTAGRVSISTRQTPVLEALLSQTAQTYTNTSPLSAAETSTIAAAMGTLAYASGAPTVNIPVNLADIASFVPTAATSTPTLSPKKFYRESIARALAGGQTRTWNLMFDVVTQAGRFPRGQSSSGDFLVEGENHSWISVAIDRFTGKIVDLQVEKVYE